MVIIMSAPDKRLVSDYSIDSALQLIVPFNDTPRTKKTKVQRLVLFTVLSFPRLLKWKIFSVPECSCSFLCSAGTIIFCMCGQQRAL